MNSLGETEGFVLLTPVSLLLSLPFLLSQFRCTSECRKDAVNLLHERSLWGGFGSWLQLFLPCVHLCLTHCCGLRSLSGREK